MNFFFFSSLSWKNVSKFSFFRNEKQKSNRKEKSPRKKVGNQFTCEILSAFHVFNNFLSLSLRSRCDASGCWQGETRLKACEETKNSIIHSCSAMCDKTVTFVDKTRRIFRKKKKTFLNYDENFMRKF